MDFVHPTPREYCGIRDAVLNNGAEVCVDGCVENRKRARITSFMARAYLVWVQTASRCGRGSQEAILRSLYVSCRNTAVPKQIEPRTDRHKDAGMKVQRMPRDFLAESCELVTYIRRGRIIYSAVRFQ